MPHRAAGEGRGPVTPTSSSVNGMVNPQEFPAPPSPPADLPGPLCALILSQAQHLTDDGRSDLSLAITLSGHPELHLARQYLESKYRKGHDPALPTAGALRQLRRVQSLARQRVHQAPPVVQLSRGHDDRAVLLCLDPNSPLYSTRPPDGRARGRVVTYPLSRADALSTWAARHGVRVAFTDQDLAAVRDRPGGTLRVQLGVTGEPERLDYAGGLDLDRDRDARALTGHQRLSPRAGRFEPGALTAAVAFAQRHQLHVSVSAVGEVITVPAPHRRPLHPRVTQACDTLMSLDNSRRHPQTPDHERYAAG